MLEQLVCSFPVLCCDPHYGPQKDFDQASSQPHAALCLTAAI